MAMFTAALLCATLLQAPQLPIAVLQSGQHVECINASVGNLEFDTPFGLYRNPTDPIVAIQDGQQQAENLDKLRRQDLLDDYGWLQALSTAGQLSALTSACEEVLALQPHNLYPYELLDSWGARLDVVPRDLDRDKRVAWLWKRATGKDFTAAVMAGAQLLQEVSLSSQASNDRIVSIRELRRALRSKHLVQRRIGALVAGRQGQFSMREDLLEASIREVLEPVRAAAAAAAHELHAHSARQYWVRNLARGYRSHRDNAAWNLGHYGGADAVNALIHVLAAGEHKPPERFEFAGRTIWVVSKRDSNVLDLGGYNPEQREVDFQHLSNDLEFIDLGSTFTVTRYGDSLRVLILEALDTWAGEKTGRDTKAWLDWYVNVWLPNRP
jgi:hypothetical protein